jgi:hypothetical protein
VDRVSARPAKNLERSEDEANAGGHGMGGDEDRPGRKHGMDARSGRLPFWTIAADRSRRDAFRASQVSFVGYFSDK